MSDRLVRQLEDGAVAQEDAVLAARWGKSCAVTKGAAIGIERRGR
jgi:hypothetical protein